MDPLEQILSAHINYVVLEEPKEIIDYSVDLQVPELDYRLLLGMTENEYAESLREFEKEIPKFIHIMRSALKSNNFHIKVDKQEAYMNFKENKLRIFYIENMDRANKVVEAVYNLSKDVITSATHFQLGKRAEYLRGSSPNSVIKFGFESLHYLANHNKQKQLFVDSILNQ